MPRGSKFRPSAANLPCTQRGCPRTFRSESGRTNHVRTAHPKFDGHRLPVNPQEVIPESPTSSSVSGGSPMMLSSPLQSPSPVPEQHECEPEEYIPRLKRTYHPFINGLSPHIYHLENCMLISFCIKVDHVMQMGTTSLKEPLHRLELKRTVTTGLRLRAKPNLTSQISCTAERKCRRAILTNSLNYGIFHLRTTGDWAHLLAINTYMIQLMQLRKVGRFRTKCIHDDNGLIYWMLQVMHRGSVSRHFLQMTRRMHQTGKGRSTRYGFGTQVLLSEISSQTLILITSLTQHRMWRLIGTDSDDGLISCQLIMYGDAV